MREMQKLLAAVKVAKTMLESKSESANRKMKKKGVERPLDKEELFVRKERLKEEERKKEARRARGEERILYWEEKRGWRASSSTKSVIHWRDTKTLPNAEMKAEFYMGDARRTRR